MSRMSEPLQPEAKSCKVVQLQFIPVSCNVMPSSGNCPDWLKQIILEPKAGQNFQVTHNDSRISFPMLQIWARGTAVPFEASSKVACCCSMHQPRPPQWPRKDKNLSPQPFERMGRIHYQSLYIKFLLWQNVMVIFSFYIPVVSVFTWLFSFCIISKFILFFLIFQSVNLMYLVKKKQLLILLYFY